MLQQTDVIFHLQQQNAATYITDLHKNFLTMSQQLLTQANPVTTSKIVLNGCELEPINSHGIRLLILLLIYTRRQQKRLLFFGLSEHNRYVLLITRLTEFIDIADTTTLSVSIFHTT